MDATELRTHQHTKPIIDYLESIGWQQFDHHNRPDAPANTSQALMAEIWPEYCDWNWHDPKTGCLLKFYGNGEWILSRAKGRDTYSGGYCDFILNSEDAIWQIQDALAWAESGLDL